MKWPSVYRIWSVSPMGFHPAPSRLYEKAAALKPADAMERLDVEHAKSELE